MPRTALHAATTAAAVRAAVRGGAEIEARELLTVPMLHADVNTDLVVAFAPRADLSP